MYVVILFSIILSLSSENFALTGFIDKWIDSKIAGWMDGSHMQRQLVIGCIISLSICLSICGCDVCGKVALICDNMIPRRSSSYCTCRGLIRVISDTCVGVQRLLISKPAAAAVHSDAAVQNSTARPPRSRRGDSAARR